MPALPEKVKVTKPLSMRSKRPLILLFLSILFILIGLGFFLYKENLLPFFTQKYKLKSFVKKMESQTALIEYPSAIWKDKLNESYSKALSENDPGKQFEALNSSFEILAKMYLMKPDEKTRRTLEDFKGYLANNYKGSYEKGKFEIACLDDGCELPTQPDEVAELTSRIEKLASIDEGIKKSALQVIKNASVYKEPSEKWSFYDSAFQLLKSEYKKDNTNGELRAILEKLAEYIKNNFQEDYEHVIKLNGESDRYKL